MNSEFEVSVCVVTYNHEDYLEQCLQSLVDQKTTFTFEVIVGEDKSTDKTRMIVEKFHKKFPLLVTPIYHDFNVGPVKNLLSTYKMARGRYICHIDGDDFAFPGKLQKQWNLLKKNSDCVICTHDMTVVNSKGEVVRRRYRRHSQVKNSLSDLYKQLPFFAHSSKMFVNDLDDLFWDQLDCHALDIEIHTHQAQKGLIYHIDEPLGGYRINVGTSFQNPKKINPLIVEGTVRVYENALRDPSINQCELKKHYAKSILAYSYQSAIRGDTEGMRLYLKKSLAISKFSKIQIIFLLLSFIPVIMMNLCRLNEKLRKFN